jgi:hypothetical protein
MGWGSPGWGVLAPLPGCNLFPDEIRGCRCRSTPGYCLATLRVGGIARLPLGFKYLKYNRFHQMFLKSVPVWEGRGVAGPRMGAAKAPSPLAFCRRTPKAVGQAGSLSHLEEASGLEWRVRFIAVLLK